MTRKLTRADLQEALLSPNVRAFLAAIRLGEGTGDCLGYRRIVGGELFADFADHPRKPVRIERLDLTSTAAGAYQFLAGTWDALVAQYGFADFRPETQDEAAVALIAGRGALEDARAGRIPDAVRKCAREWASLPGAPYGQRRETLARVVAEYKRCGGLMEDEMQTLAAGPAPEETPAPHATEAASAPAAEVMGTPIHTLAELASGAPRKPQAPPQPDPAMPRPDVKAIGRQLEAELGITPDPQRHANRPALIVTVLILPAIYLVIAAVLFGDGWSDTVRTMVVTAVISGGLATVVNYFLGSSAGSKASGDVVREIAARK